MKSNNGFERLFDHCNPCNGIVKASKIKKIRYIIKLKLKYESILKRSSPVQVITECQPFSCLIEIIQPSIVNGVLEENVNVGKTIEIHEKAIIINIYKDTALSLLYLEIIDNILQIEIYISKQISVTKVQQSYQLILDKVPAFCVPKKDVKFVNNFKQLKDTYYQLQNQSLTEQSIDGNYLKLKTNFPAIITVKSVINRWIDKNSFSVARNYEEINPRIRHSLINRKQCNLYKSRRLPMRKQEIIYINHSNNNNDHSRDNMKELMEFDKTPHYSIRKTVNSKSNKIPFKQLSDKVNLKNKIFNQIILSSKIQNAKLEKMKEYLFYFRLFRDISEKFSGEIIDLTLSNINLSSTVKDMKLKLIREKLSISSRLIRSNNCFLTDGIFHQEVAIQLTSFQNEFFIAVVWGFHEVDLQVTVVNIDLNISNCHLFEHYHNYLINARILSNDDNPQNILNTTPCVTFSDFKSQTLHHYPDLTTKDYFRTSNKLNKVQSSQLALENKIQSEAINLKYNLSMKTRSNLQYAQSVICILDKMALLKRGQPLCNLHKS